jgi:hypothetical protein
MNLKDLISIINITFRQISFKKIMPLIEEEYIVVDILKEYDYKLSKESKESIDYIDLELGNGKQLITEEKMLYFYNKV